jgi:dTDP-4-amino-4,6-dideoxygalactose transaminase
MKVPFVDLNALNSQLKDELRDTVAAVIERNDFILGCSVEEFESSFASYVGRAHCIGVNSGTAALHLALLAIGVQAGDEVVTTPSTWISTCWAISYCGARPAFSDVDPATGDLDPASAARRINERTRAIVTVDLYGNPSRLDVLGELARSRGIALVDDACQAHGARLLGRPVGSFGDIACFSFYPAKNLGAFGEGGAVVTDDPEMAARLRQLRDHAQDRRHHHTEVGFNYRMDGLQGAVLSVKLRHLDDWNTARRRAADRYLSELVRIPGIVLPSETPGARSNWHLFVIRIQNRDAVRQRLSEMFVETGVHYPVPVHLQPAYAYLGYQSGDFPESERLAASCLSLPISPVISPLEQDRVIETLSLAAKEAA